MLSRKTSSALRTESLPKSQQAGSFPAQQIELDPSDLQSKRQLGSHPCPGVVPQISLLPPRQLRSRTFLCIMYSNLIATPSLSLVCVWAKEDESPLELNERYIYANFKE